MFMSFAGLLRACIIRVTIHGYLDTTRHQKIEYRQSSCNVYVNLRFYVLLCACFVEKTAYMRVILIDQNIKLYNHYG
jgi:hypothetical protein